MVPQGPPGPLGGEPVPSSLSRSNSALLGGQGGGMPLQNAFSSLVSPCNQFNNMNMIGNATNVSSLVHQSFGNGAPVSRPSQQGLIDGCVNPDQLPSVGSGMEYNHLSSSFMSTSVAAPNSSSQVQRQQQFSNNYSSQMMVDQKQAQQIDHPKFQHNQQQLQQFSNPGNPQPQQESQKQQRQQFQAMRTGLGGMEPVKLEPTDQTSQKLQALRDIGSVKLEPQQLQSMGSLGPVKMEPQTTDSSPFLHQQQLLLSRQSSQAVAAAQFLHQQRLLQLQHQQLLKSMPQQRPSLQTEKLPIRTPVKPAYEPGMCARRLMHYMYQQRHRPEDNNIEFWRKFVAEYFAPNAKKKWCVSTYGNGRQTTGVFPQDVWHCEICNRKPGRGFEATVEVLPRLFKIKYESGTIEELLYIDMPREYQNPSGQIVLDYAKAIQESVFEQLRVIRDGQLRVVFSPDLKICSWEFCARRHEELIPRRLLIPQVSQLGAAAQKCQATTQNTSSNTVASDLQSNCNMLVASAIQLAKSLEVPLVNDLGYTKRYVRCLQISEVVNSMKDLIDYSRETGTGPIESLNKISRKTNPSNSFQGQPQQPDALPQQQQQQLMMDESTNNGNPAQSADMQVASSNDMPSVSKYMKPEPATLSSGTAVGLLHQSSLNSRQQNPTPASSPYAGNNTKMPSPGSLNTLPQNQPTPSLQSPMPSSSNNPQPTSHTSLSGAHLNPVNSPNVSTLPSPSSGDAEVNGSQSSVQKILQDMMMSSQLDGSALTGMGMVDSNMKIISGMLSARSNTGMSGGNVLAGNQAANDSPGISSLVYRRAVSGLGQYAMVNGIRSAHSNNSVSVNTGRPAMTQQQHSLCDQLLNGLGTMNGYNNPPFEWKESP